MQKISYTHFFTFDDGDVRVHFTNRGLFRDHIKKLKSGFLCLK